MHPYPGWIGELYSEGNYGVVLML